MSKYPVILRSLTLGLPIEELGPPSWEQLRAFLVSSRKLLQVRGMELRTIRLVLPLITAEAQLDHVRLGSLVASVTNNAHKAGIRWVCLPISAEWPRGGADDLRMLGPALLRTYNSLFINYLFSDLPVRGVCNTEDQYSVTARMALEISRLSNNGFDNFRMGAGSHIVPDTPFFPFSYHMGERCFSLAVESLDPLLQCFSSHMASSPTPTNVLRGELEALCSRVEDAARTLSSLYDIEYRGLDISLAPYPDESHSIAFLMEKLGLRRFGCLGTAAATFFLTDLLKDALLGSGATANGFNGVMFSPLEDRGIAMRMDEGEWQVENFMLWATLCGCGVDMVPLSGATKADNIAALYRDVNTLSKRHRKPLGVRILPIPGRRINEKTAFNHDFLVNCRILGLCGAIEPQWYPRDHASIHSDIWGAQ